MGMLLHPDDGSARADVCRAERDGSAPGPLWQLCGASEICLHILTAWGVPEHANRAGLTPASRQRRRGAARGSGACRPFEAAHEPFVLMQTGCAAAACRRPAAFATTHGRKLDG
jgi:hypothetical protein